MKRSTVSIFWGSSCQFDRFRQIFRQIDKVFSYLLFIRAVMRNVSGDKDEMKFSIKWLEARHVMEKRIKITRRWMEHCTAFKNFFATANNSRGLWKLNSNDTKQWWLSFISLQLAPDAFLSALIARVPPGIRCVRCQMMEPLCRLFVCWIFTLSCEMTVGKDRFILI